MRRRINIYKHKTRRLHKWLDRKSGNFEKDQEAKKETEKCIRLLFK